MPLLLPVLLRPSSCRRQGPGGGAARRACTRPHRPGPDRQPSDWAGERGRCRAGASPAQQRRASAALPRLHCIALLLLLLGVGRICRCTLAPLACQPPRELPSRRCDDLRASPLPCATQRELQHERKTLKVAVGPSQPPAPPPKQQQPRSPKHGQQQGGGGQPPPPQQQQQQQQQQQGANGTLADTIKSNPVLNKYFAVRVWGRCLRLVGWPRRRWKAVASGLESRRPVAGLATRAPPRCTRWLLHETAAAAACHPPARPSIPAPFATLSGGQRGGGGGGAAGDWRGRRAGGWRRPGGGAPGRADRDRAGAHPLGPGSWAGRDRGNMHHGLLVGPAHHTGVACVCGGWVGGWVGAQHARCSMAKT